MRLVGGWALPPWKMMDWKSLGMMTFPNIWRNKKCSKPPTSNTFHLWIFKTEVYHGLPSSKHTKSHGKWTIYEWFTYIKMVIFHSYVKLPENTLCADSRSFKASSILATSCACWSSRDKKSAAKLDIRKRHSGFDWPWMIIILTQLWLSDYGWRSSWILNGN